MIHRPDDETWAAFVAAIQEAAKIFAEIDAKGDGGQAGVMAALAAVEDMLQACGAQAEEYAPFLRLQMAFSDLKAGAAVDSIFLPTKKPSPGPKPTGIFPNARVNVAAYGEAAGEELGRYSADIVKLTAERARRTSKTLPSIAQLVEWAVAEAKQREQQHRAFQTAMRGYRAAIKRGEEQAHAMIEKAGLSDRLTLESLDNFHRGLTGDSLGIQPEPPIVYSGGRSMPCYVTQMTALYRLISQGHEGAAAWLVTAACESERLHALVDAAGQWETHSNAWHEFMDQCRQDLTALLAEQGK